jgi:hypothetical protein
MPIGRKTKAVKLTSACYPEQENAPILGSNLDALIKVNYLFSLFTSFKYALMTPQKLSEIGKYVEKRVLKAILKKQYGFLYIILFFDQIQLPKNLFRYLSCHHQFVHRQLTNLLRSLRSKFSSRNHETVQKSRQHQPDTLERHSRNGLRDGTFRKKHIFISSSSNSQNSDLITTLPNIKTSASF